MSHASSASDLSNLIRKVEQLHPSQRLHFIRLDFQQRRRRDAAVLIESYLDAFPALPEQDALDLIYHEVVLREELNEKPVLDEYVRRFPKWKDALSRQFMLHEALAEDSMLSQSLPALTVSHADGDSLPADQQPTVVGSRKASTEPTLPTIPGYRIDSVLGKGAMGVVFKAWQEKPPRFVALKMILGQADDKERRRFLSETEAVGRLQHANIVQIFQVSEAEGLPFFSMELASGGTLAKKLGGVPWSAKDAAAMILTLAQAMHHAHQRSIVHRDLKPGNVLLSADGAPKISDFGLAKQVDAPESHTVSGAIVGTPSYMAPEQARAVKDIGPPADIYALGAILYEMLTGRPPFRGETLWDTVSQVIADDPVPPRRLQPRVPIDLETIALKCLHKDPKRRYADADALAKDLRRFLDGVPIEARPVPVWERVHMWARRRPMVAGLLALLTLVVVLGFTLVTKFWLDAERLADHLAKQQDREAAKAYSNFIEHADRNLFVNKDLRQARKQLELCNDKLRGWEWRYLARLCNAPSTKINTPPHEWRHIVARRHRVVAFAADDGAVVLWDIEANVCEQSFDVGTPVLDIQRGGTLHVLAARGDQAELLWLDTGGKVTPLARHKGLEMSPDGGRWAWTENASAIQLGPHARELPRTSKLPVTKLAFAPGRPMLASGSGDVDPSQIGIGLVRGSRPGTGVPDAGNAKPGEVVVWDLDSGKPRKLGEHADAVHALAFHRDELLASGGADQAVILWDVKKGTKLAEHRRHADMITHLSFSPRGQHLVSVDRDGVLHLADVSEPPQYVVVRSFKSADRPVFAWSRDGLFFAVANTEGLRPGEVQVWQLADMQPIRHFLGHVGPITALAFDAMKPRLLSAGADKTVQMWDLDQDPHARLLQRDVVAASWSSSGDVIAWASDDGVLTLWNPRKQAMTWSRGGHADLVLALAFTSDGERLISSAKDSGSRGEVKVWSCAEGKLLATLPEQPGVPLLAAHPSKPILAVPGEKNAIRLWDVGEMRVVGELPGHDQPITVLRFLADGTLLSAGEDGVLKLWDTTKQSLRAHKQLDSGGLLVAAPWKNLLAWVGKGQPRTVRFVKAGDLANVDGELVEDESQDAVNNLATTADGSRLLVGTTRGEIGIWDPAHGHRLLGLRSAQPIALRLVIPDPAGKAILSLGKERNLLLRSE